ncbi:MAG: hypothetical protein NWE89_12245 [Candidatus Bathyarchaeota archaeon]|nr:hypothetical protein [Candidatus Bathyarchaeota archaeon]
MATSIGAFFLDTCILLNRVLGEDTSRTNKLFNDMGNNDALCWLSESVDIECNVTIMKTINFIGDTLRDFFIGALEYLLSYQDRTMNDKFTNKDIELIEEIFITIQDSDVLKTPSRNLEEHIIHIAEDKLNKNEDFTFNELIINITTEILTLTNSLQDRYENIFLIVKPKVAVYRERPDSTKVTQINNSHRDIHNPDTVHLASVIKYKEKENKDAIFVTVDNGMLKNRYMLRNRFDIVVSDPLYAIHKFS